jgi:hypothetical protein
MKRCLSIIFLFVALGNNAQVLYSERFNTLALASYTSGTIVCQYTNAPANLSLIQDGHWNNIGSNNNYNVPFHVPALKSAGWTTLYNQTEQDTFLVCTSWFDSTNVTANRWFITPTVNVSANTIISWLAKAPDPSYPDGYTVYATNKTGVLVPSDFTAGDILVSVADANTPGGGEKSYWNRRSHHIGSVITGPVRFAFRNNSTNMYQIWIDDIEVKTMTNVRDAAATGISCNKYFKKGTAQTLSVTVANTGAEYFQNVTLNYKYGNSSVNTQTFNLTPTVSAMQSTVLEFPQKFNFTTAGYYEIKAWLSQTNGTADVDKSNDTIRCFVTAQDTFPVKKVLIEQFVSANDGENPDAQEKVLGMQSASVINVNIHTADSWTVTGTDNLKNTYMKKTSTAMIDRVYQSDLNAVAVSRPSYVGKTFSRLNNITPAEVVISNVNYFSGTRALSFLVSAKFYGEVKGDYRIGAYLTENHVCGKQTDTLIDGRNQLSNYFNTPWSPYYQKGYYNPGASCWVLDAWRFKQQNTLVYMFDGTDGVAGIIPSNGGTNGQIYSKTYTLTVPTETYVNQFKTDNIYIVAFVAEYSADSLQRNILNVAKVKATPNGEDVGMKEEIMNEELSIYPNPSKGIFYLLRNNISGPLQLSVYTITGQEVKKLKADTEKEIELDLKDLAPGMYLLKMAGKMGACTHKLIIER